MTIRVLLAAVLSAVVLFVWGFAFWVVLPLGGMMVRTAPNEDEITRVLSSHLPETGVYFLPSPDGMKATDEAAKEAFLRRHAQGPLVQVFFNKAGVKAGDPTVFALGFGQLFAGSLLAALLLCLALPGLPSYLARVLFVFLLGVYASVSITLGNSIWYHHPWDFSLMQAGFHVVAYLLSGLVMGLVVRPRPA